MSEQPTGPEQQKQAEGYRKLLETARHYIEEAGEKTAPIVEKAVEKAEEALSAAGEYTREEAEKLGDYLRRDLHDAADYMERTGREYASRSRPHWRRVSCAWRIAPEPSWPTGSSSPRPTPGTAARSPGRAPCNASIAVSCCISTSRGMFHPAPNVMAAVSAA